jgi:hypothetical protein
MRQSRETFVEISLVNNRKVRSTETLQDLAAHEYFVNNPRNPALFIVAIYSSTSGQESLPSVVNSLAYEPL